MKTHSRYIFLAVFGFMAATLHAQQFIGAKSFVKQNKIYLRFVASDFKTLNQCKEDGFVVRRIAWEQPTLPDSSKFRGNVLVTIKPWAGDDERWDSLTTKNTTAGLIYNLLYEPASNATQKIDMVYGLGMISCDFSTEVATAAGLFYIDENVPKGKYAYLIQPKNAKAAKAIKPAILLVNAGVDDILKDIDTVKINVRRKVVNLNWEEESLQEYYAGYFIERSEDGTNFVQLNKVPHVQVKTQYEKNKTHISYNDTLTEFNKTYYYRVRGLGFFGLYGNYSKVVKCSLVKPLDAVPTIDSTHLVKDTVLEIHWRMPEKFDLNELRGYNIFRSDKIKGKYDKINTSLLPKETKMFTDANPNASNYYKVIAYSRYGDSAASFPILGLLPDITPPLTPLGLRGKVDTAGKVTLSWSPNKEKDLQGYRVFRNNASNEEMVEVTKKILTDTVFQDQLYVKTLTENVFYSLTAVDQVYNNSPYTKHLKLKRPDKIKPVAAMIYPLTHIDTCVIVKWIPSTSSDATTYELWRTEKGGQKQKIKEWKALDSLREYRDDSLAYGKYYMYEIKVTDDDGNFSASSSEYHYYDSRIRKPISKINYKIDLEKRSILLDWEYPEKGLYSFMIYKAKVGEPLKIIKTVQGNVFKYEDKDLYIGNKYVYKIKAMYNSGVESKISEGVNVDF